MLSSEPCVASPTRLCRGASAAGPRRGGLTLGRARLGRAGAELAKSAAETSRAFTKEVEKELAKQGGKQGGKPGGGGG